MHNHVPSSVQLTPDCMTNDVESGVTREKLRAEVVVETCSGVGTCHRCWFNRNGKGMSKW